jgi:Ribbon-helix-helix protein, copG family
MLSIIMARSIVVNEKKRGRGRPLKPGGQDVLVAGRIPPSLAAVLDAYADKAGITRSEAVRRLIEAGLKRRPKA